MKPTHPGRVLKNMYVEPLGLDNGAAAENLGVTRKTLSQLLNERQGISAEMALRLAKAFDTTPELWMNIQRNFDLWKAEQRVTLAKIKQFRRAKAMPSETIILKRKTAKPVISHGVKKNQM